MDDSDIIATSNNTNDPAQTLQRMQKILDRWEGAAKATGGAIKAEKSWTYLVYFDWNKGLWSYGDDSSLSSLKTLDYENKSVEIQRLPPTKAMKMLGVWLAPDGNHKAQYEYLLEKAQQLSEYIRTGHVNRHEAWVSLNLMATKTIEYCLPATTFSEEELNNIMKPLFKQFLLRAGLNCNTRGDILYGPLKYQGHGIKSPYVTQGCLHVHNFLDHCWKKSITGNLIRNSMEQMRLEFGTNCNLFESDYKKFKKWTLTKSWMQHLWQFISSNGITIEDDTPIVPLLREGDCCLVESFMRNKSIDPSDYPSINRCRIYLKHL